MLDFNSSDSLSETIAQLIDEGLQAKQSKQPPRNYLGASRLGVSCERALQYEYFNTPKDPGRDFTGRTLRIFEAGHVFEHLMIGWLRLAGFDLTTERNNGSQYGFSVLDGKVKGHIDGVIKAAPSSLGFSYPMLWEAKSLSNTSWKDTKKKGVSVSKPIYAGQIALYQAYLENEFPGIHQQPALFTAINKDTAQLHFELVPFDGQLAQQCSDKGVKIISACDAQELLPRISSDPTHRECKLCAWQDRCWGGDTL